MTVLRHIQAVWGNIQAVFRTTPGSIRTNQGCFMTNAGKVHEMPFIFYKFFFGSF